MQRGKNSYNNNLDVLADSANSRESSMTNAAHNIDAPNNVKPICGNYLI